MNQGSVDNHDPKLRLFFIAIGLAMLVGALAVTVAWFMLIGHAFVALLDFLAASPAAGANGGD